MDADKIKRSDWVWSMLFLLLTVGFILLMIFNQAFFDWTWGRHHNMLSWYIRPFAIIPFIYFAYRRKLAGMMASVFALATSMAWFPEPASVSPQVIDFLSMEVDYMSSSWTISKIMWTMCVPLFFILLAMAFWKRSFVYGGVILIVTAVMKVGWSVIEGGESGLALIPPAAIGLIATIALLYFAKRYQNKKAQAIPDHK